MPLYRGAYAATLAAAAAGHGSSYLELCQSIAKLDLLDTMRTVGAQSMLGLLLSQDCHNFSGFKSRLLLSIVKFD